MVARLTARRIEVMIVSISLKANVEARRTTCAEHDEHRTAAWRVLVFPRSECKCLAKQKFSYNVSCSTTVSWCLSPRVAVATRYNKPAKTSYCTWNSMLCARYF